MITETIGAPIAAPVIVEPVIGDASKVRRWLLEYLHSCQKRAEDVSRDELWNAVKQAEAAYGIDKKAIDSQQAGIKAASVDSDYAVETFDLADQVDEMTALINNLLKSGPLRRLVAKPGITEEQAELTAKVQDSLLKEKDFEHTLRIFAGRFVKHRVAGVKVVRSREISYITDQVEVPLTDPMTGEDYSDYSLMQMGFSPEAIENGSAIRQVLAAKGLTFVGIADADEEGYYSKLLCTECREVPRDYVYIEPLDASRIAVSDMSRPTSEQLSIHEYRYQTLNDLRRGYYPNLGELKENGSPIYSANQQNPGDNSSHNGATQGTLDRPVYQIVETWTEIDWQDAIEDRKFTEEDLVAFAEEEGFPVNECRYTSQKWRAYHNDGNVLLKVHPNYLLDKSEYPHDMDSFIFGDGRMAGQGLMERLSNVAANLTAFLNMGAYNLKQQLNMPLVVSARCEMTDDDIKRFRKLGGFFRSEGQIEIGRDIQWVIPPDVSGPAMKMVGYFSDKLRQLGVPAVLAGEGSAETATQETINNRRGQTVVNEAFARMMNVLMNAYRKHLSCMVSTLTTARYIDIVGENGSTMTRKWTQPKEITDKLDIVPLISYDDANRQRIVQFLISTANVFAASLMPPELREMLWVVLRKGGVDESDIEKIKGALGTATNVQQEVEAMMGRPDLHPEVRMEDPHAICIQFAGQAMQQEMMQAQQEGRPPRDMTNISEYIQQHEGMLQQQKMMEMQQMMMAAGPQAQGKPVQGRPDGGPGTDEGAARQEAQMSGPGNQGIESAAGLTGQASAPVMGADQV